MRKSIVVFLIFWMQFGFCQLSDFSEIDFTKADAIAKNYKPKGDLDIQKVTTSITQHLQTDVEKARAIFVWITHNIANDFGLYSKNNRKRNKFYQDSIRLHEWNSVFKKKLFKKLINNKKTICTGYAILFKEMCAVVDIEAEIVHGLGRTAEVDLESIKEPNHTWNVVKLNNKWYLVDTTWATGISHLDGKGFVFEFNDGYFLTNPELFIYNHYPLELQFSLLENTPDFTTFTEKPMVYGVGYQYIEKIIQPTTIYHQLKKDSTYTFQYQLKKEINPDKIKLILTSGSDTKVSPIIDMKNKILSLTHTFNRRGFYDVHLYYDDKILITYTFEISK